MVDFNNLKTVYDNGQMFEAITGFPDQIEISLKSMENWHPKHPPKLL